MTRYHTDDQPALLCETCQQEPPFWIFPDCKKCSAAYVLARPHAWNSNRKFYASTVECAEFEAEVARQQESLVMLARAMG